MPTDSSSYRANDLFNGRKEILFLYPVCKSNIDIYPDPVLLGGDDGHRHGIAMDVFPVVVLAFAVHVDSAAIDVLKPLQEQPYDFGLFVPGQVHIAEHPAEPDDGIVSLLRLAGMGRGSRNRQDLFFLFERPV